MATVGSKRKRIDISTDFIIELSDTEEDVIGEKTRELEKLNYQLKVVKKELSQHAKLAEEFHMREKALNRNSDDDIVKLNVGGKIINTYRSTLLHAKSSFLSAMFTGKWEDSATRDGTKHGLY